LRCGLASAIALGAVFLSGRGASALVRVEVDLGGQKMRVAADSGESYEWPISSGRLGAACRLHPVLPEVVAELAEIRERILAVRIDCHPLRALGRRVDGVKADGDFAFEVASDCVQREAEPLAGFLVLGSVVVMPVAFRAWPVGLEGVSPAVDEEVEVVRHCAGERFETKIPHFFLPEGRLTVPLLLVGGEKIGFSVT